MKLSVNIYNVIIFIFCLNNIFQSFFFFFNKIYTVILLNGSIPIKYGLSLNSDSTFCVVKQEISKLCSLNVNNLLICELFNSQIKRVYGDNEKLQPTTLKELYIYELPPEQKLCHMQGNTIGKYLNKYNYKTIKYAL